MFCGLFVFDVLSGSRVCFMRLLGFARFRVQGFRVGGYGVWGVGCIGIGVGGLRVFVGSRVYRDWGWGFKGFWGV